MFEFTLRNALEQIARMAGVREPQRVQPQAHVFVNSLGLPGKFDASAQRKATPDMLCVHVTAVRGGYGVSRKLLTACRAEVDAGYAHTPTELRGTLINTGGSLDEQAHRLAILTRYKTAPYHFIGARNGDTVANNPMLRRTPHGNAGGNGGIGVAFDCAPDEDLSPETIEGFRYALNTALQSLCTLQNSNEPAVTVTAHRCYSNQRSGDPGREIWRRVVLPVVANWPHNVSIDYRARQGTGKPIPNTWDDAALFNAQGKLLK